MFLHQGKYLLKLYCRFNVISNSHRFQMHTRSATLNISHQYQYIINQLQNIKISNFIISVTKSVTSSARTAQQNTYLLFIAYRRFIRFIEGLYYASYPPRTVMLWLWKIVSKLGASVETSQRQLPLLANVRSVSITRSIPDLLSCK